MLQIQLRSQYREGDVSLRFARLLEVDLFTSDELDAPVATASVLVLDVEALRAHPCVLVTLVPDRDLAGWRVEYGPASTLLSLIGSSWQWVAEDCSRASLVYMWNYRTDGEGWYMGAIGTRLLEQLRPHLPSSADVVIDLQASCEMDEITASWIQEQFQGVQALGLALQANYGLVTRGWGALTQTGNRNVTVAFRLP